MLDQVLTGREWVPQNKTHVSDSTVLRTAGTLLFAGRRWLDPSNAHDFELLDQQFDRLCTFPSFNTCTRDNFMQTLSDVCETWTRRLAEDAVITCKSIADYGPSISKTAIVMRSRIEEDERFPQVRFVPFDKTFLTSMITTNLQLETNTLPDRAP
jgi:hypothetical protein